MTDKELLDEKIKKFDKAVIHWIFTIGISMLTAFITTLALLK